jgi:hypothetical protein
MPQEFAEIKEDTNGVYGKNYSIRLADGHPTPAAWSQVFVPTIHAFACALGAILELSPTSVET